MSAVAELSWNFGYAQKTRGVLLPEIFRVWHRAKKLGMPLRSVEVDGHAIPTDALERLNLWIEADGAWRASLLDHFECEKLLSAVLKRHVRVTCGPAGAGRWPTGTTAEEILRNRGEGVQTVLWREIREPAQDHSRKFGGF